MSKTGAPHHVFICARWTYPYARAASLCTATQPTCARNDRLCSNCPIQQDKKKSKHGPIPAPASVIQVEKPKTRGRQAATESPSRHRNACNIRLDEGMCSVVEINNPRARRHALTIQRDPCMGAVIGGRFGRPGRIAKHR